MAPTLDLVNLSAGQNFSMANGVEIFFFSLILKAILFISEDGELRVSPRCDNFNNSSEAYRNQAMLEFCTEAEGEEQQCSYVSPSRKHMLVADAKTGMLTTVPTPTSLGDVPSGLCATFDRRRDVPPYHKLYSCSGASRRHAVSFKTEKLSGQSSCDRSQDLFYQSIIGGGRKRRIHLISNWGMPSKCQEMENDWRRSSCRHSLRKSYPLHFFGCAHTPAK